MAALVGSWELVSATNQEKLMDAFGITDPTRREMFMKAKPSWKISQSGDMWKVTQSTPHRSVEYEFRSGQEVEHDSLDGRRMKSTISVEGDKFVEHHVDCADASSVTDIIREVSGENMICTIRMMGIESIITFKRAA